MELIRKFGGISKNDAGIAGGKGASLGEMTQAGIPVPPGFVVLSSSFEHFLEQTDLNVEIDAVLDTVKHDEMHTVEFASGKIQGLILNSEMPENIQAEILFHFEELDTEYVAVRSSATAEDSSEAAWAGQLDSFLNTTEATLLQNVRRCWASLFTPRAIFYRFEKELHKQKISVAVVVQKMVNSEKSGIAFSVHPVTEDRNQLIIEAGFGLGEAIVSGSVTPDSYVVTKEPLDIIDINISEQTRALYRVQAGGNEWKDMGEEGNNQVLDKNQIQELSNLIIKIESHYGFPCDIEWAFEQNTFYITQSRPITTLSGGISENNTIKYSLLIEEKEASPFVASNLCEVMATRLSPYISISPHSLFHFQKNDLFWCADLVKWDNAAKEIVGSVLTNPASYENFNLELNKDIELLKQFSRKWYFADIASLSNEDLLNLFSDGVEKYSKVYERGIIPTIADLHEPFLTNSLKKLLASVENSDEAFIALTTPETPSDILKEEKELLGIGLSSQVEDQAIEQHQKKYFWLTYGYSGPEYSSEAIKDRLSLISHDKDKNIERLEEIKSWEDVVAKNIKDTEINLNLDANTKAVFQVARQWIYLKGTRKEAFFMCYALFDKIAEAISLRFGVELKYVKFMTKSEIENLLDRQQAPDDLLDRTGESVWFYQDNRVIALSGTEARKFLSIYRQDVTITDKGLVKGQIAYPGLVTGVVKIVNQPSDMKKINEGDILVSVQTNPNIIPAMQKAAGFLTDLGGITSHAAIVAREMKKPCVIGAKVATKIFKDGDYIELDATNGIATIITK